MKIQSPLKDLTLVQIVRRFDTDAKARQHLEAVLWKDGIVCPHCQCKDQTKFWNIAANCADEFTRREGENVVSTCGVESYFSLLKRGVVGVFHHVSAQHLPLYLAEFDHRHNCRKMTDGERTDLGLAKAAGKRLVYHA